MRLHPNYSHAGLRLMLLLLLQLSELPHARLNSECVCTEGEECFHLCNQTLTTAHKWCFALNCVACNGGSLFLSYVQTSNVVCLSAGWSA